MTGYDFHPVACQNTIYKYKQSKHDPFCFMGPWGVILHGK